MDLNATKKMGQGESYVAPDPHFISSLSLFSTSLPWDKFEHFFETKKLVNLGGSEQIILLRLIALQELLCLNDDDLLKWTKHQLYLFSFMQTGFKARLPTKALLVEFRSKLDEIGLLKPFRKQCHRIIKEHESRFPPLVHARKAGEKTSISQFKKDIKNYKHRTVSDTKVDLHNIENSSDLECPSCGSQNVVNLSASQEASTLPNISFSRCRFCGSTFRD